MADMDAKAALRAFLAGAKGIRASVDPVLGGIMGSLLAELREEGLIKTVAVPPLSVRVTAPGCARVVATGVARRQNDAVVPCVLFTVDGRAVFVKLLHFNGAWTWSESAGLGVDGQALSSTNMQRVLLALLSGEV
jgi:hypothetical protein